MKKIFGRNVLEFIADLMEEGLSEENAEYIASYEYGLLEA